MKNQLFEEGTITEIGAKQTFAAKDGGNVITRLLVLDTESPTRDGGVWHDIKAFTFFNENAEALDGFHNGENVRVYFTWKSREYNGRYYHNITGKGVKRISDIERASKQTKGSPNGWGQFGTRI